MNLNGDFNEKLGKPSVMDVIKEKINIWRGGKTIEKFNARPMKISHRIALSAISVVTVMAVCVLSCMGILMSKVNRTNLNDMVGTGGEWLSIYEVVDSEYQIDDGTSYEELEFIEEVTVSEGQTVYDEDVINILLIGADNSDGTSRSDSMMIVSVDYRNKQLKITSLMRDMYVAIPKKSSNRINSSYNWGGAKLLVETIEHNFKVKIDNVVILDFDAFKTFIDKTGGITVYLNEKQAKYMTRYAYVKFPSAGTYTLSGKTALEYVRMRKVDSDFGRTTRQREVFEQLFDKVKVYNAIDLANLAYDMLDYIETDLSNKQIIALLSDATEIANYEVKQFSLPVEGTYADKTINKMRLLVFDVDQNAQLLGDFIYSGDFDTENPLDN